MSSLYPVIVDWIPGLPKQPYRGGVGQWEGVVMHQTGTPGDSARSERKYETTTYENAFVHEFIDPNDIIQVANPNFLAYGAGHMANLRFIHLELCSANSQDEFESSFDKWCQRAAYYLTQKKFEVIPAMADGSGTLWSHWDVTQWLGGTTHEDPIAYLAAWGKEWQHVIDRVQQHVDLIKKGVDNLLSVKDANTIIAFLSAAYSATDVPQAQEEFHRLANELRRASGQP
jgi:N-acetylmuramoyl-L-alanine amidase CwlA